MRTFLAYMALVALPLLALVFVLRHGTAIEAPPAVSGAWVTEVEHDDVRVEVTQSGRYLSVRVDGAVESLELVHGDQRTRVSIGSGACAGSIAELRRSGDEIALRALERTCELPERLVLRKEAR
jgi:hypothetical protein